MSVKPSERNEVVAKLRLFVAEEKPVLTKLGKVIGVGGHALSNYCNDASLPSGENYKLMKLFFDKTPEEQKEAYTGYLMANGGIPLEKRVLLLEAAYAKLKKAYDLLAAKYEPAALEEARMPGEVIQLPIEQFICKNDTEMKQA
jgi:hypothetical protein